MKYTGLLRHVTIKRARANGYFSRYSGGGIDLYIPTRSYTPPHLGSVTWETMKKKKRSFKSSAIESGGRVSVVRLLSRRATMGWVARLTLKSEIGRTAIGRSKLLFVVAIVGNL